MFLEDCSGEHKIEFQDLYEVLLPKSVMQVYTVLDMVNAKQFHDLLTQNKHEVLRKRARISHGL